MNQAKKQGNIGNSKNRTLLFEFRKQRMAESTDNIEHRCVLIKTNGDLEEVKVVLSDKEAVKKLVGGDAEYKGEMEGRQIAILGYCL